MPTMLLSIRDQNLPFDAVGDPTLAANMASTSSQSTASAFNIYIYNPSQTLAIVFTILYSITVPLYIYLCIILPRRIKKSQSQSVPVDKHKYTIPLLVASIISTTGYTVRIISVQPSNQGSIPLYATSSSNIVISPIFICATLYLTLVKLIRRTLPSQALGVKIPAQRFLCMSPRWLGAVFISSDVLSFMTQGAGSAIAASGNWQGTQKDVGTDVLLVGLALQTVTFSLFLVVLGQFCVRFRSTRSAKAAVGGEGNVAFGMWIASAFVLTRSIFRIVEFGMGIDGYPFQHEWMLYVFDAMGVWIALVALAYWHPIRWLGSEAEADAVVGYSPVQSDKH